MNKRVVISIREARTCLSRLVEQIETGSCSEIVIARAGKPVARLVSVAKQSITPGVAEGAFDIPDDIDRLDPLIEEMFMPADRRRSKAKRKTRRSARDTFSIR
jgi:prevent-host-death family protein